MGAPDFYAHAGVNVSLGDAFSAFCKTACTSTWKNSPYVRTHDYAEQSFRGPRMFNFQCLPEGWEMDLGSDGVGTKVGIVSAARAHGTCGHDLIAMKCMDRTRWGGLPLVCTNVLDVKTLGSDAESPTCRAYVELIEGMRDAANTIGVVLWGGETAELGQFVGSEDPHALTAFNWSGAALGVSHSKKRITGENMRAGDIVIALYEDGARSNGISAIRKAFAQAFGKRWWAHPDAQSWIQKAAHPSELYDYFLCTMNGWYAESFEPVVEMRCIVHVTGGGIPGKFWKDILVPLGLSAELDDLWEPPGILRQCAEWYRIDGTSMPDRECYTTWPSGQGALVVVPPADESTFIQEATRAGIPAKSCGRIVKKDTPQLIIRSHYRGGILEWN